MNVPSVNKRSINRRCFLFALLLPQVVGVASAAVRGREVMYVGGSIADLPEKIEGRLDLESEDKASFQSKKGTFSFGYKNITSLEYGQKAGRRVGVAVAVSPLFLLSKKRRHYLTVGYTDGDGNAQGVVFEVGKKHVRDILSTLESRSGKSVEYESEEAREHVGN